MHESLYFYVQSFTKINQLKFSTYLRNFQYIIQYTVWLQYDMSLQIILCSLCQCNYKNICTSLKSRTPQCLVYFSWECMLNCWYNNYVWYIIWKPNSQAFIWYTFLYATSLLYTLPCKNNKACANHCIFMSNLLI